MQLMFCLPLHSPLQLACQVETVGDCYVVASGLMADDGEGFVTFCPNHSPADSATRLVEFAKSALAHSRSVMLPQSDTPVTVSACLKGGEPYPAQCMYGAPSRGDQAK